MSTTPDVFDMQEEDIQYLTDIGIQLPLTSQELPRFLPHAYPFIMLDRVTSCCPKQSICGFKNLTINEEFFTGHFPKQPLMPGVLMLEAMAQLSGILGFISEKQQLSDGFSFLFAGVDKVKFKNSVIPGDKLSLRSQLIAHKSNIFKFSCDAMVDDKLATVADITLVKQKIDW